MSSLGKLLLLLADRLPFVGRMPGDVLIRRKSFTFCFPLTTCILLSPLLSLVVWLLSRK